MSSLTPVEKEIFEILFGMDSGYVLDFSNPKFDRVFVSVLGFSIYQDKYSLYGDSKAKRLRAFWDSESDSNVFKILTEILKFYDLTTKDEIKHKEKELYLKAKKVLQRLSGANATNEEVDEEQFLLRNFPKISLSTVDIDQSLIPVLEQRLEETAKCLKIGASLSVIFLCGSILEGILLGVASRNPRLFNESSVAPTKEGKVKFHRDWTLSELIDVVYDLGFLSLDVKKFSHVLRDFRNYIHPHQQLCQNFSPTMHTAEMCLQVLNAAIFSLTASKVQISA